MSELETSPRQVDKSLLDLRIDILRQRIMFVKRNRKKNEEELASLLWLRERENPGAYQEESRQY
jgi:hypothetical protein